MQTTPMKRYAMSQINAVLLKDEDGLVQAILPSDRILDLSRLARLSGRHLNPVIGSELEKLRDRYRLQEAPLVQSDDVTTYVDTACSPRMNTRYCKAGWTGRAT